MPAYLREIASNAAPGPESSEGGMATAMAEKAISAPPASTPAPSPEEALGRSASREVTAAQQVYEAFVAEVRPLEAAVAAPESARRHLAQLEQKDTERLEDWFRGGRVGPRPLPSPEIAEAERELWVLERDAVVAGKILADKQPELARLTDRLRDAGRRLNDAAFAADAARQIRRLEGEGADGLRVFLAARAAAQSHQQELRARGAGASPPVTSAYAAASRIDDALARVLRETGVEFDAGLGGRELDALIAEFALA